MSTARRILTGADVLPPMDLESAKPENPPKRKGKPASGRFGILNRFVDETMRTLDRTAACVWLILYRDTKPNGFACTSQTDIARRAGASVSAVHRALRRLDKYGLFVMVRKGRLNVGVSVCRSQPLMIDKCP